TITTVLLFLPLLAQGQFDVCRSLRDSEGGPGWEFYACQPSPSNMKEVMQIRVDPPGITCGNPPERFCTLENPYLCSDECDASSPDLSHPPQLMGDRERGGLITYWQSVTWSRYPEPLLANITLSWNKSLELVDDITLTFEYGRATSMVLEKSLDKGENINVWPKTINDLREVYIFKAERIETQSSSLSYEPMIQFIFASRSIITFAEQIIKLNKRIHFSSLTTEFAESDQLPTETLPNKFLPDIIPPPDSPLITLSPTQSPLYIIRPNVPLPDKPLPNISQINQFAEFCSLQMQKSTSNCNDFAPECRLCPFIYAIISFVFFPPVSFPDCECNDHSSRCSYIDFINVVTCVSCKHNTRGQRCQYCRLGFYRNASLPLNDENVCAVCDCDEERSVSPHCSDDGACQCKPGASGRRCDSCLPGYTWRANGSGCTEKVCDEESLMCQNGGTCIDFQRCICPDKFTGVFCEESIC
uniref:Uncharacterized protein n=1 Tax=Tetraodon nigroviridis TaxID=99883 RepID=H3CB27_TETNG